MIVSQWTTCNDCHDPDCDGGCPTPITPVNRRLSTLMLPSFYEQQPTTLDAEMIAELDAEREDHALFKVEDHGNLEGDPIARGLTSDEEDAEVGRLWGIDASRIEGGE